MMLIHLLQIIPDIATAMPDVSAWGEPVHHVFHISPSDWSVIAQQFETDVFADFRTFFNNFIQSGQIWAFIIGIVIGYLLRGLTTYG